MLLAADAGLIELAAIPIVTAAMPTGAASFLTFTLTPIHPATTQCPPRIYPADQSRKANCGRSMRGCRARRTRLTGNAGHCRRDYTVGNINPIDPSSWEDACDADGKPAQAQ